MPLSTQLPSTCLDEDRAPSFAPVGDAEGRLVHAERPGDPVLDRDVERHPARRLDDLAEPVGVDPVDVRVPGSASSGAVKIDIDAGEDVGGARGGFPLDQVRAPEPVAEAGGVGEELLDGRPARGRAQSRGVAVPAVEHLDVGELGAVGVDGRVEVEVALLDQLERGDRRDHLGHRHDPEVGVGGQRLAADRGLGARGAPVDDAVAVGRDGGDAGHITSVDRRLQDAVNGMCRQWPR